MGTYVDLDGVDGGTLEGPFVRSVSGVFEAMRFHRVCSAASDHGSITVWRDDRDGWWCGFSRWRVDLDKQRFKSKAKVREWLKNTWPRMTCGDSNGTGNRAKLPHCRKGTLTCP